MNMAHDSSRFMHIENVGKLNGCSLEDRKINIVIVGESTRHHKTGAYFISIENINYHLNE